MKKKIIGICICMLVLATALPAVGTLNKNTMSKTNQNPSVEWEYTYGGDEFDWFFDVQSTTDGGYVAAGLSEEDNMYYAWIVKVNATGGEEFSKVNYNFNGSIIDSDILVHCVRETPDHGFIVCGMGSFYSTMYGMWINIGHLWKVDASGNTEWFKPLVSEPEMWYFVPFIIENFDGTGFMIAGFYLYFTSPTEYYMDVGLGKIDFDGNLQWKGHYDLEGNNYEFARSLWKTTDGGYFLSGTSSKSSAYDGFFMIKTYSNGTLENYKIFNGPGNDYCSTHGCRQTSDGGYIMSGISDSYGAGGTDLWIIKTDANFNETWNKTYGGPNNDRNYCMDATKDGGYVFVVIKNAYILTGTKEDTWIIITDSDGNLKRELLIEEEGTQWSCSINQTDDGGFIVAGRTGPMGNPVSDGLILKIRPMADLDCKGELKWTKVKPGSTVTGEFQVGNVGPEGSLLNWEIESIPTWGNWTFIPNSGTDLEAGSWVTVEVSVVAPSEAGAYTGKVKIINSDYPDDFFKILVSLKPKVRSINGFNFLHWILQKNPNMFPILRHLIGL